MSELEFNYNIRASLRPKPESPALLGAKFLQTLDALSRIDPAIFTNWQVMDFPAMAPFPGKDRGEISLESGGYKVFPDPAIVTYPVFKATLLAINSIWPQAWPCAYAFKMDYDRKPLLPDEPLFPYSVFHVPWLAYLSDPLAAGWRLSAHCLRQTPRSHRQGTPAACAGVGGNPDRANRLSARRGH
jgi:hypothetical protein